MSVYIKGMEIPGSCFDCPFMLHRSFCLVNTKIEFTDEEYQELKGRYIGCPLVPVPPHGRWNNIIQGIVPSGQCSNYGAWDKVTRFCPNCGADMREPPKEGE